MSATPKKKLCWNCEGRVSFSEENCSFCGVYLSPSSADFEEVDSAKTTSKGSEKTIPFDSFNTDSNLERVENKENNANVDDALDQENDSGLTALALLLAGSIFLIFGIILLTFSKQGTLTLKWDATYWYAYISIAAIFLAAGWRSSK